MEAVQLVSEISMIARSGQEKISNAMLDVAKRGHETTSPRDSSQRHHIFADRYIRALQLSWPVSLGADVNVG
jgi:hypothetical protein